MSLCTQIHIIHKGKGKHNNQQEPRPFLHEDPVPGICIILNDLHANFFGTEQTGDSSATESQGEIGKVGKRRGDKKGIYQEHGQGVVEGFLLLPLRVGFLRNILTFDLSLRLLWRNKDEFSLKMLLTSFALWAHYWVIRVWRKNCFISKRHKRVLVLLKCYWASAPQYGGEWYVWYREAPSGEAHSNGYVRSFISVHSTVKCTKYLSINLIFPWWWAKTKITRLNELQKQKQTLRQRSLHHTSIIPQTVRNKLYDNVSSR